MTKKSKKNKFFISVCLLCTNFSYFLFRNGLVLKFLDLIWFSRKVEMNHSSPWSLSCCLSRSIFLFGIVFFLQDIKMFFWGSMYVQVLHLMNDTDTQKKYIHCVCDWGSPLSASIWPSRLNQDIDDLNMLDTWNLLLFLWHFFSEKY